MRAPRWLLPMFMALLLPCACGSAKARQQAQAHLDAAKARYQSLVLAGVAPGNAKYDEVLTELKAVPADLEPVSSEARKLERALGQARVRPPPPPLAHPEGVDMTDAERELANGCVRLAQALGRADAGERAALQAGLDECKRKTRVLEESAHPRGP